MAINSLWKSTSGRIGTSLESAVVEEGILDVENPGVVLDEASQANEFAYIAIEAAEVSADVDEAQRSVSALDNGEQVAEVADAVIAEQGEDMSAPVASLIQAGAAQTVAATGAPDEAVDEVAESVSTESFGRIVVSTEGFKETLLKIWQRIKDFVSGIIKRISDSWNRFFNSTASVMKKVKAARKALADKSSELKEDDKIKWQGSFKALIDSKTGDFSAKGTVAKFAELAKDTDDMTGKTTEVINKFDQMKTELMKLDSEDKVRDALRAGFAALPGARNTTLEDDYPDGYKASGELLPLGGKGLAMAWKDDAEGPNELINSFRCEIVTAKKSEVSAGDYKEKALDKKDIAQLLDNVEKVCKSLEKWYNGESKKAHAAALKFRDNIEKEVKKADAEGDRGRALKAVTRLYLIPAQMFRGIMALCVLMIQTSNAGVSLVNACISLYKDGGK